MKQVVIAILLLTASSVLGATHVINSLPYTFDANSQVVGSVDTLILAGTKLSSPTDGLRLTSVWQNPLHDLVLNLGTDTISFGEAGGDGHYGLRIGGTGVYFPHHIKVVGGYILHNPVDSTADRNRCVTMTGHDLLLEDVNAVVKGYNGTTLYGSGDSSYSNEISGGVYRSEVTGFDSRCNFDACVMLFNRHFRATLQASGADFHFDIHDVIIDGGPHAGIVVYKSEPKFKIHDNDIMTDARNDFYLTNDGLCHSTSNPYGIVLAYPDAGTKIYNNTITSGTQFGGNRGILIERAAGTAENPVEIYDNIINVHEGPNVEYGDNLPLHGLRMRYGNQYVHVYDNTIICVGDNLSSTGSYGSVVHTLRYSCDEGTSHNLFEGNRIIARALTPGVVTNALIFDGLGASPPVDPTFVIRNNYLESSGTIVKYGEYNGGGPGIVLSGDTLAFASTAYDPATFYVGHKLNNWNCSGNIARDLVYKNGASDTNIVFSGNGTLDIAIQRSTMNIHVVDIDGLNISGAVVTVVDGSGDTVINESTDSGYVTITPVTYFRASRSDGREDLNDFTIKVEKEGDITTTTIHIDDTSFCNPVCTLYNTTGSEDVTSPAPTIDLSAVTSDVSLYGEGKIDLTWTASGDDGMLGIASYYKIKYSLDPITADNFANVTDSMSDPSPPGYPESAVLASLNPGELYYVALKTYDEADNGSEISNVDTATASVLHLGLGGDTEVDTSSYLAYPNPVYFSLGQQVTFRLPDESNDLLIMTVSGDLVRQVRGVSGQWTWNGLNSSGHQVSAEKYLWYLVGTNYSGKIVVK